MIKTTKQAKAKRKAATQIRLRVEWDESNAHKHGIKSPFYAFIRLLFEVVVFPLSTHFNRKDIFAVQKRTGTKYAKHMQ